MCKRTIATLMCLLAVMLTATVCFTTTPAEPTVKVRTSSATYTPTSTTAPSEPSSTTVGTTSEASESSQWIEFKITAYCPCAKCCGKWAGYKMPNGRYPEQGRTIAADLSVLPRGTIVEIEGIGLRIVEDCGSAVKGNIIDLFFATHEDALAWGSKRLLVRVVKEADDER